MMASTQASGLAYTFFRMALRTNLPHGLKTCDWGQMIEDHTPSPNVRHSCRINLLANGLSQAQAGAYHFFFASIDKSLP